MTTFDGVGYTDDSIENLAAGGYLRTEDVLTGPGSTITRGGVASTNSTYLLEPLLAITREAQYTADNSATLDIDYSGLINSFLKNKTPSQPITFDSFADDYIDYVALQLGNDPDLTSTVLADLKSRLSTALDLTVRANLGIFRDSQDYIPLSDAISPTSSTVPDLTLAQGGSIITITAWASGLHASIETTDHNAAFTPALPTSTWAFDNFQTSQGFPSDVLHDISERAFADFFDKHIGAGPADLLPAAEDYFVRFAHIPDYMNVVAAFTSGLTDAQQASIFKNFIVNLYFNPANNNAFRLSADIGPFIDKMSANYLAALTGSSTNVNSSVSGSFPKVRILQRIYALIVEMIGVIQEVTASQSQQLKIMTQVQADMTSLMNDIHVFTSGDGSEVDSSSSTSVDQTNRDSLNTVGTAWSDTIRANRDFLQNAAKSYQSNINSSNDAVNQQASMATSFIQELSTLLGAIYR